MEHQNFWLFALSIAVGCAIWDCINALLDALVIVVREYFKHRS